MRKKPSKKVLMSYPKESVIMFKSPNFSVGSYYCYFSNLCLCLKENTSCLKTDDVLSFLNISPKTWYNFLKEAKALKVLDVNSLRKQYISINPHFARIQGILPRRDVVFWTKENNVKIPTIFSII